MRGSSSRVSAPARRARRGFDGASSPGNEAFGRFATRYGTITIRHKECDA